MGAHGGAEPIFRQFFVDLGLLLGSPEGRFGGPFSACFPKRTFFTSFLVIFLETLKRERKWSSPRGGGHAIGPRLCMFRERRPLSTWLRFGLHFGVILEAEIATILFFGRPGRKNKPQRGTCFRRSFLCGFSARAPPPFWRGLRHGGVPLG